MNDASQDRAFLAAALEDLETYLLSDELYYRASVPTADFTRLTPGAILLVHERLRGWKVPGLEKLSLRLEQIRSKWRSAWEAKARREVRARSELWREYLIEVRLNPIEAGRLYPYQVRLRTILTLLLNDLDQPPPETLIALDAELRRFFRPGPFVWEAALAWVFPAETFWYLYGAISSGEQHDRRS